MNNIKNYNFNKLDLRLSNSDYWDFFLSTDEGTQYTPFVTSGDCLVVYYDFNNPNIYITGSTSGSSIYSLVSWNDAINSGYTLSTIGLTGIDNGLIIFDKLSGDTKNEALLDALTGSTLVIPSGETRFIMNKVTGTTGNFVYPIDTLSGLSGNYANFCGGFYQGYYKLDGYSYEILPTRVHQAWAAEFWLNPQNNCSGITNTLNDQYPNNKGFFFYMGTRAENKFWNQFNGIDTGCTKDCTQPSGCTDTISNWCTIPKENDITLIGDNGIGIPLNPPQLEIELVTNPFLIYGRANSHSTYNKLTGLTDSFIYETEYTGHTDNCNCNCFKCSGPNDGLGNQTVCSYDKQGIFVTRTKNIKTNTTNPFLIYGRGRKNSSSCGCLSCSGPNDGLGNETVCSFSGFTSPEDNLDNRLDIIDNALGFRITDDGRIGYRLLTVTGTCTTGNTYISGVSVSEGYSLSGIVSANTWSYIVIKFVSEYFNDCELKNKKPRKGKLMFYVNGKLKYIVNEFDEFVARRLNEYKSKQIGVPFNFSLGGGSQGLIESQTFDGLDLDDRNLNIEKNFAGSFIGGISQFKFNICNLTYDNIVYNYELDAERYGINISNHGYC